MTPWVTRIIFINVAMLILAPSGSRLSWELLLVPALVPVRPWTPVTYMFRQGGFVHLLFNYCLGGIGLFLGNYTLRV